MTSTDPHNDGWRAKSVLESTSQYHINNVEQQRTSPATDDTKYMSQGKQSCVFGSKTF